MTHAHFARMVPQGEADGLRAHGGSATEAPRHPAPKAAGRHSQFWILCVGLGASEAEGIRYKLSWNSFVDPPNLHAEH